MPFEVERANRDFLRFNRSAATLDSCTWLFRGMKESGFSRLPPDVMMAFAKACAHLQAHAKDTAAIIEALRDLRDRASGVLDADRGASVARDIVYRCEMPLAYAAAGYLEAVGPHEEIAEAMAP